MLCTRNFFDIDFGYELPILEGNSDLIPAIDPTYLFNIEITQAIVASIKFNKKLLIHGLHGTGKSTHIEQIAARMKWPCFRINFDGHITRLDLIGRDVISVKEGKQVIDFQEGIIPWAIQQHMILILDEYDAIRPEVMFIFQRLLEKNGKFSLIEKNTVINPHPNFRIFATSNTIGEGDEYGIYHGTNLLNHAQLDRWDVILKMGFLSSAEEERLLLEKCPTIEKYLITQSISLASLTRNSFLAGDMSSFMSHRTLINLFENYQIFQNIEKALRYSFYNRCNSEDKEVFKEYFQRCFNLEMNEG
jgi:cobaltochelatase CobS